MTMKRGRRGDLGIEVLTLLDLALEDTETPLKDRAAEAGEAILNALRSSLANPSRLGGHQVQNAFETVAVVLGAARLVKTEDAGVYYVDDAEGELTPPDFKVVLHDGTRLLIEVKLGGPPNLERHHHDIRIKDFDATRRYAEADGARLLYAHLWPEVWEWTLVDPAAFVSVASKPSVRRLVFEDAMKANEMALLGDAMLGTAPPLRLSLLASPDEQNSEPGKKSGERSVQFRVADVELSSASQRINSPEEIRLAMFLMMYGPWEMNEEVRLDSQGQVAAVDYIASPYAPDEKARLEVERHGIALVGSLSGMYTRWFTNAVTTEDGAVQALRSEPPVDRLGGLVPVDYWDRPHRTLRLLLLRQQPVIPNPPTA